MRYYWTLAGLVLAATPAVSQTLTAREIFWGAGRESTVKPAPASPAKKKAVEPARAPQPQLPAQREADESSRDRAATRPSAPERADVQYVAAKTEASKPLGMRYSIHRREETGDYIEVDQDTRFHTGDRIRVVVESNDAGYLYVVQQGTSGRWQTLFPSEEVGGGNNKIERGQSYTLPAPGAVFTMRPPAGTERLFLVLSRQPVTDIEKLIYSLEDRTRPEAPQRAMLAQNFVPDGLVRQIRAQSRDLLIEKVDDTKPAAAAQPKPAAPAVASRPSEKAVYVVNAAGGANARVVADIELRHE